MKTTDQTKANGAAQVEWLEAEAMKAIEATFVVESDSQPGKFYAVNVVRARQGDHAGELYLSCSCPAGRYSWSPAGFRPCKHSRRVIVAQAISLENGHFARLGQEVVAA
jgi:hypothetical protein